MAEDDLRILSLADSPPPTLGCCRSRVFAGGRTICSRQVGAAFARFDAPFLHEAFGRLIPWFASIAGVFGRVCSRPSRRRRLECYVVVEEKMHQRPRPPRPTSTSSQRRGGVLKLNQPRSGHAHHAQAYVESHSRRRRPWGLWGAGGQAIAPCRRPPTMVRSFRSKGVNPTTGRGRNLLLGRHESHITRPARSGQGTHVFECQSSTD